MEKHKPVEQPASNEADIVDALESGKLPVLDVGEVGLNGASIIAKVHARLPQRQRLREAAQAHFLSVEGTELSETEMRKFAASVRRMLDEIGGKDGIGFKVLEGKHEGRVGRLVVVLSGPKREPRFGIAGRGFTSNMRAYGMRVPRLVLESAEPDGRKRRNEL